MQLHAPQSGLYSLKSIIHSLINGDDSLIHCGFHLSKKACQTTIEGFQQSVARRTVECRRRDVRRRGRRKGSHSSRPPKSVSMGGEGRRSDREQRRPIIGAVVDAEGTIDFSPRFWPRTQLEARPRSRRRSVQRTTAPPHSIAVPKPGHLQKALPVECSHRRRVQSKGGSPQTSPIFQPESQYAPQFLGREREELRATEKPRNAGDAQREMRTEAAIRSPRRSDASGSIPSAESFFEGSASPGRCGVHAARREAGPH
ncbi:hypothetical protein ISCGN_000745 [Ixodes scapularis]